MIFVTLRYYYDDYSYTFKHEITKDDVVEFLWEQSYDFNIKFDSSYTLQPDWKEHYNKAEKLYLENEVDEYALSENPDFIEFCLNKYEDEIQDRIQETLDEIEDEVYEYKQDLLSEWDSEEKWV